MVDPHRESEYRDRATNREISSRGTPALSGAGVLTHILLEMALQPPGVEIFLLGRQF